jgi:hypothetical protein
VESGEECVGVSFASMRTDARRGGVAGREGPAAMGRSSPSTWASNQAERGEAGLAGAGVDRWAVLMSGEGERVDRTKSSSSSGADISISSEG